MSLLINASLNTLGRGPVTPVLASIGTLLQPWGLNLNRLYLIKEPLFFYSGSGYDSMAFILNAYPLHALSLNRHPSLINDAVKSCIVIFKDSQS